MPRRSHSELLPDGKLMTAGFLPDVSVSFDVAEQSHAPQDPVLRRERGLQVHGCDVVHVGPERLLVDGAGVEAGILHTCSTETQTN